MKYVRVIVNHLGGPDALQIVEEECPEPKNGEVRVRVTAAGVSYADLLMREGVHPESPAPPFTPGWDLIGAVERLGNGVSGLELGQTVAAMPITGGYSELVCLPERELIPVPSGLDPVEAVSLVLNYITAYQMLHRSAEVKPSQRVLIHSAAGGVGTALLQLGRLAGLEMYGTCSLQSASVVSDHGGIPIDYRNQDFVKEIRRLTRDGVDVVFDGIGGAHVWRSREVLRPGGRVVAYGFTSSLSGGRLASGQRHQGFVEIGLTVSAINLWLLPARKRVVVYSIQRLKRRRPEWFRQDLMILFDLLQQRKINPLIARRFPLSGARDAQELLGKGGVKGKIVLLCSNSSRSEKM